MDIHLTEKQFRQMKRFVWKRMQVRASGERMTDTGGLGAFVSAFDDSPLARELEWRLPRRTGNRTHGSYRMVLELISSFLYGHDCLDDLEEFRDDPYMEEALDGKVAAARTMGDFLRDFEEEHIEHLNQFLVIQTRSYRKHLSKALEEKYVSKILIGDIDSTDHEQSGDLMEGLAWNYKGHWCLDSQVMFDDYGFNGGLQLRPGNTKSGVEAEKLIEQFYSRKRFSEKAILRGDSAYCEQDVIRTCMRLGITYIIAAHDAYTNWKEERKQITEWVEWKYTDAEKNKAAKTGRKLPKIELGRYYWTPGWASNIKIPVVVKRTWKEGEPRKKKKKRGEQEEQVRLPFEMGMGGGWEYYAVVTNANLFKMSYQEIFEIYKKRGNAERFIREEKYGYDLKHLPCQSLMANHAYALIGMIAHNLLRWAAIIERPDKPNFAKKMRRRLIHVPGKVVSHARQITLKIPQRYYEEVTRFQQALTATPMPLLDTS